MKWQWLVTVEHACPFYRLIKSRKERTQTFSREWGMGWIAQKSRHWLESMPVLRAVFFHMLTKQWKSKLWPLESIVISPFWWETQRMEDKRIVLWKSFVCGSNSECTLRHSLWERKQVDSWSEAFRRGAGIPQVLVQACRSGLHSAPNLLIITDSAAFMLRDTLVMGGGARTTARPSFCRFTLPTEAPKQCFKVMLVI